jgi:hypothetical protein
MPDLRQIRGLEIAATRTIRKHDGWRWVPSQTGSKLYRVQLTTKCANSAMILYSRRVVRWREYWAVTCVKALACV